MRRTCRVLVCCAQLFSSITLTPYISPLTHAMDTLTVIEIFYFISFVFMSVSCAMCTPIGYRNSRDLPDKIISLVFGCAATYGFATLAIEAYAKLST